MTKTVVISGGPGSGKTTIINQLTQRGYLCYDEVSREIILAAQKKGIDQLFLTDPEAFSNQVLSGRINQFKEAKASNENIVFIDRGIPDIVAYMNFKGEDSPEKYTTACAALRYNFVFLLPPWKKIYKQDNERYETFEQAVDIYNNLVDTYTNLGYEVVEVPFGNLTDRVNYILNVVEYS